MVTLATIAELLDCPVPAGESPVITGVAALTSSKSNEISYLSTEAFVRELSHCEAAALVVQKKINLPPTWTRPVFPVDDAELALGKILKLFAPPVPRPPAGVDSLAHVDPSAVLAEGAAVGPFVFIGRRVSLGARTVIHPGVYIGDDSTLGDDCEIFPNVTIRERITIGHRVIIHANSAIGSDGFGYRWDGRQHVKIPQIGTIVIEDDVEIGSCTCVDRAKFGVTRVGRDTKLDNLVQVAHNSTLGPHCIMAGQAGLAGSCTLGTGVILGGQCAIRDHVTIGDGAMVAGACGVADDVEAKQIVSGIPAIPHRQTLREQKALRRLPDLQVQVRALQEEIAQLKKK